MDYPHKAVVDEMILGVPGVTGGKAFGYPAYRFGKKVFCWAAQKGVTLKLPTPRIEELLASDPNASFFSPDGNAIWREWILFKRDDPEDFHDLRALFDESITFVSGG
jgi:hypothetical protein